MALTAGARVGDYEIVSQLGVGGMGVVYRAFDQRLRRDVAVKVLPDDLAADPTTRSRIEREARFLAQFQHPNIGSVFGLAESRDGLALILELVEGPTLDERIAQGPIPRSQVLELAHQLAAALEAAHAKGIIHRDLKPQNIKLTGDGTLKVLDFGLAKALETEPGATAASELPGLTTLTLTESTEGSIVGTAGYMAPEQVKGLRATKQADIWAFGVVLWEMLTGEQLFAMPSVPETLSAVLSAEISFERLPQGTSPAVRRLLRRCLERDSKNRLHDVGDARLVLADELAGRGGDDTSAPRLDASVETRGPVASVLTTRWLILAATAALLGVAAFLWLRSRPSAPPVRGRFEISLPAGEQLDAFFRRAVALSPDGRTLAVIASTAAEPPALAGSLERRIELRELDGEVFRPVVGTEGALELAFSPDGRWLAFTIFTGFGAPGASYGEVRKVPVEGGRPTTVCTCRPGSGLSWGDDGRIVFGGVHNDPIWTVSVDGGVAEPLVRPEAEGPEYALVHPFLVPGKPVLLYSTRDLLADTSRLFAQRLGEDRRTLLAEAATDPRFAPPDHLYFAREGSIYHASLDIDVLRLRSEPKPIVEGVAHALHTGWQGSSSGIAQYDVAASGILAYGPGSIAREFPKHLLWIDSEGRETALGARPGNYNDVRIEPQGRRILLARSYPGQQVELFDPARGTQGAVTFGAKPGFAVWGPGRGEITFASSHDGSFGLYSRSLDDPVGPPIALTLERFSYAAPSVWSADGRSLYFVAIESSDKGKTTIRVLEPPSPSRPLFDSPYSVAYPEPSPDGRWLVYGVGELGGPQQVWVRPLGRAGSPLQVSVDGGIQPAWTRDGRSILFSRDSADRSFADAVALFRVSASERDGRLILGSPERILEGRFGPSTPVRSYDFAEDGRLLVLSRAHLSKSDRDDLSSRLMPKRLQVQIGPLGSDDNKPVP